MTADSLARALEARRCGAGWNSLCPAHKDKNPSLSICEKNGKILVHCHAGCSQHTVIEVLRSRGLWPQTEPRQWSPADRREWRRQQRYLAQHIRSATLWRRAALALGDAILDGLKVALCDLSLPRPGVGEIAFWTDQLATWDQLDGAALVAEYLWWLKYDPRLTSGMVQAAEHRQTAERRAVEAYLRLAAVAAIL